MKKSVFITALVLMLMQLISIAQPPPPPGPLYPCPLCACFESPFGGCGIEITEDYQNNFITASSNSICPNNEVILSADSVNLCFGAFFTFLWSNGSTDPIISVFPFETTEYSVVVTRWYERDIIYEGSYWGPTYLPAESCTSYITIEALPCTEYYRDFDEDGFGNPDSLVYLADMPGYGYSLNNLDCNDFDFQLTQPGIPCDDFDACTVEDIVTPDCTCIGTFADGDNDGICDANDNFIGTTAAPPGIPYQAEVRNDSGEVLANANVNVRYTLHELTASGAVSYQETHAITTNELGLFAATIGAGTATQGTFASINWAQTTKFLQVEVDAGNGYITMGNQQLMSVPYALYAANGPAGPQGPAGPVGPQGPAGAEGQPGANGLSAYEVWLTEGNIGNEQDFLNSINNSSQQVFTNRDLKSKSLGPVPTASTVLDSIHVLAGQFVKYTGLTQQNFGPPSNSMTLSFTNNLNQAVSMTGWILRFDNFYQYWRGSEIFNGSSFTFNNSNLQNLNILSTFEITYLSPIEQTIYVRVAAQNLSPANSISLTTIKF